MLELSPAALLGLSPAALLGLEPRADLHDRSSMSLSHLSHQLRQPFVALALCALLAQQMVGFVLTASPAMAYESGFSLCLSGPLSSGDDPLDIVGGAGFCPCTMQHVAGVLPAQSAVEPAVPPRAELFIPVAQTRADMGLTTGPPPARAPPANLHIV